MGIRDLMKWAKDVYPEVFTSHPKRWNSPGIKGKRIAIDGTLLTNRFHFAIQDGPLKGKGGLVGWFNLIGILRKHDIKPIVVFDERGPREWKAPAAARRLAARALTLSRRSHEDQRADRLAQWQEAFIELESLAEDEKMAVRAHFDRHSKSTTSTAEERNAIQEKLESTTSLDMTEIDAAMERITAMIDTLSDLQAEFLAKTSSGVSRKDPEGLTEALRHASELERLHEAIGDPSRPSDIYRSPPEEEETSILDEALEQVVPEDAFRESRKQKELTEEEGQIIPSLLSGQVGIMTKSSGEEQEEPVEVEEIFTPDQRSPMSRLDDLIQATPEVRAMYQRALNMPSPSDHDACRDLVIKMGVPVLEAEIPYEAEGLAASLANAGLVDFVGTEDSDVVAYEAPLLRNVSSSQKPLVLISSSQLRSKSELSPSAFVDFCILLGTDASPRIPGVGPKRAFTLIKEHGSIENILQQEKYRTRVKDMEGFMSMVGNAREVFGKAPPIPDGVSLEQGVYDEVEVEAWLKDTHGVMFVEQEQVGDVDQAWEVDSTGETLRPSGALKEWDESWDQAILDREPKEPLSPR